MFDFWRRLRRADVIDAEFPDSLRAVVADTVPLYRHLPEPDRRKLEALVRIFLAEKHFEGAGGLELDEAMEVAIAARACLLVLHRVELDEPLFPDLDTVVVYPRAYRARAVGQEASVVLEGEQARLGESSAGRVVLAWDAVEHGARNPRDGKDVVLHEFAHQLDAEDGQMDGAPDLAKSERYVAWAKAFGPEYEALVRATERGRRGKVDAYGATNPPEFFAVVTEAFFERPEELARRAPEVYAEMVAFYRMDPASLRRASG
jgi:Mlc titration factor MtfA (ptsG expression regulator)